VIVISSLSVLMLAVTFSASTVPAFVRSMVMRIDSPKSGSPFAFPPASSSSVCSSYTMKAPPAGETATLYTFVRQLYPLIVSFAVPVVVMAGSIRIVASPFTSDTVVPCITPSLVSVQLKPSTGVPPLTTFTSREVAPTRIGAVKNASTLNGSSVQY